jgi:hypothetical protein
MQAHQEKAAGRIERNHTLIAWAVTSQERRATYIGSLQREKTGLKCDCVCPACGGRLQAINAGNPIPTVPAGKTKRPHFRHDVGQQYESCLIKMSQIVALQLLLQEKAIYLPPQTVSFPVVGASGQIYTGTSHCDGLTMEVAAREWIDEQEAKITLQDGRVVWLRLFGTVSSHPTRPGEAVILIKVDDPEVSTWPAEKILEHAQLTGKWLCWERHWQDDDLGQKAQEDGELQARHWCDYLPNDLDLPASLTQAQRSESVLHWLVKGILESATSIATPRFDEPLSRMMPDGTEESHPWFFEERFYRISNARLEHRLKDLIPDVICVAKDGTSETMELMIEVTVTHGVDEVKTERIRALGIACLEIDTRRLGKTGKTTLDELRTMVLTDTRNKRWVYHPSIERRYQVAMDFFEKKKAAINALMREEKERDNWLNTLPDEALLKEYVGLLWQVWTGNAAIDSHHRACPPDRLLPLLEKRGFKGMGAEVIVSPDGLLWALEKIVQRDPHVNPALLFERAVNGAGRINLQKYVIALGAAIVEYEPPMTDDELLQLADLRQIVKESIGNVEHTYTRTRRYENALVLLYPRLRSRLESNKGTEEVVGQVRIAKMREQETNAAQQIVQNRDSQEGRMERMELILRLEDVRLFHEWVPKTQRPHDLMSTFKHVQQNLKRRDAAYDDFWTKVLMSAWVARETNVDLADWIQSENPKNARQVAEIIKILETASMLKEKALEE